MDKIVSATKYSVVPNIGLHDGVLVLNEVIDYKRRNMKGLFIFKVDFEKAFDSIS